MMTRAGMSCLRWCGYTSDLLLKMSLNYARFARSSSGVVAAVWCEEVE